MILVIKSNSGTLWVDEWVRKSNGDRYTIQPIKLNKKYNLSIFETEYDYDYESKPELYKQPNVFLLKVVINKLEWCPDNIKIFTTFLLKEDVEDRVYYELQDSDDFDFNNMNIELLLKNNEVLISYTEKEEYIYYKIVELNFNNDIMETDIHSLCKYINPEFFNKLLYFT